MRGSPYLRSTEWQVLVEFIVDRTSYRDDAHYSVITLLVTEDRAIKWRSLEASEQALEEFKAIAMNLLGEMLHSSSSDRAKF